MPPQSAVPSKIARPHAGYGYPRDRLFRQVHDDRHRAIWVSAPAGAGKTTLAATYIESVKIRVLWYQLDHGDNDPASFFHYLKLAAQKAAPRARWNLPPLTPEYSLGLATFSRRFFEQLYLRLKPASVLVLDNHQALHPNAPVHQCLADAIALAPDGIRFIVMSREEPPAHFARLRSGGALACLRWDDLRLTERESLEMARTLSGKADATLHLEAVRRADGWAAGLVLLLEAGRAGGSSRAARGHDRETLFDYFASQVFDEAEPETRQLLMLSALLPVMSGPALEILTGDTRVERRLRELLRRNYFVTRLTESPVTYEYHALFREFLLERAAQAWDAARLGELRRDAALALIATGQGVAAVELLLLAGAWPDAVREILRLAPELARQGRLQILQRWLTALPEGEVAANAWLRYWLAGALVGTDSARALASLEAAYEAFAGSVNAAGQYMTFADAIHVTWMTGQDLAQIDGWLDRFDQLEQQRVAIPSIEIEARVLTSLLMGMYLRRLGDARVPAWLDRSRQVLDELEDPMLRAALFASLGWHYYYGLGGFRAWLQELNELLERGRPDAPPLYYLYLWVSAAYGRFFAGEFVEARRAADRGLALAAATGIHVLDSQLLGAHAKASLCLGDRAGADASIRRMAASLEAIPDRFMKTLEVTLRCWRSVLDAEGPLEAVELGREAVRVADRAGAAYPVGASRYVLAHALLEAGLAEEGLRALAQSRLRWPGGEHQHQAFQYELTEAWLCLRRGDRAAALEPLRAGLARGEAMHYGAPMVTRPGFLHPLLDLALDAGLHTAYVQRVIHQAGLAPACPADMPANWPMPVRIQSLGGFQVRLDGAPLDTSPHQRNRPLDLLRALIALGSANVAQERIAAALWPDAQGDRAITALHTTLHRLRKLLGREDAVVLKDGHLSLNERVVWVDVWAVEALLDRLARPLAGGADEAATLLDLQRRILALYRGRFLESEAERPWAQRLEDELHGRVVDACVALGRRWQTIGDTERALQAYQGALRCDPLSERLHRQVMRFHADNGDLAEALAVYEHCKKILSLNFGVRPGPATTGLYESIRKRIVEIS